MYIWYHLPGYIDQFIFIVELPMHINCYRAFVNNSCWMVPGTVDPMED